MTGLPGPFAAAPRPQWQAVALALVLAACDGGPAPALRSSSTGSPGEGSVASSAESAPDVRTAVDADALPRLVIDPATVTQYCTWVDQPSDGQEPLVCTDALELAIRATGPLQGTISQAEFRFARCGSGVCPDAGEVELRSRAAGILHVDVRRSSDGRILVGPVRPGPLPPPTPTFESPPVSRPELPGELSDREPLPFCGRIDRLAEPGPEHACFLGSVAAGKPAELIEDGFSTEGDPVIHVYRFHGSGAVLMFAGEQLPHEPWQWQHRTCAVYRLADPAVFSCG